MTDDIELDDAEREEAKRQVAEFIAKPEHQAEPGGAADAATASGSLDDPNLQEPDDE